MAAEFTPPVQETDIVSIAQYPDQRVSALTALITDATGKKFTFVVKTAGKLAAEVMDEPEEALASLDAGREPEFIVPGAEIFPSQLEEIIQELDPHLFAQYLVPQEDN